MPRMRSKKCTAGMLKRVAMTFSLLSRAWLLSLRRPFSSSSPQRLSVAEALRAYTVGAAHASGEGHLKGSLSPGKLADLVVLSHDLFSIDPMGIREAQVELTIFDGRIVYEGGGPSLRGI